jgi:hypothetical protein
MGQLITVSVHQGASPTVRIFNLNRSVTGMAIERYASVEDVKEGRPPDVLARRLFDLGVDSVTVYSSSVTATAPAENWATLEPKVVETIEHLSATTATMPAGRLTRCAPSASNRCRRPNRLRDRRAFARFVSRPPPSVARTTEMCSVSRSWMRSVRATAR